MLIEHVSCQSDRAHENVREVLRDIRLVDCSLRLTVIGCGQPKGGSHV